MNAQSDNQRVGQLDVLRAIACMCVLVAHCDSVYEMPPLPRELGPVGVAIFFALSGYLITSRLIGSAVSDSIRIDFSAFYLKRATRILPPYMLLLAVLTPLWWDEKLWWCATFCFNFLYISGSHDYFHVQQTSEAIPPIGHLWSLCVEEHYYWFWPWLLCMLGRRLAIGFLFVLVLATPAIGVWLIEALDSRGANPEIVSGVLSRITFTQLTSVAIGSLVALLDPRWLRPMPLLRLGLAPLQLAGLALIGGALWLNENGVRELFIAVCGNDAQYGQALEPTRIHFWGAGIALIGIPWTSLAALRGGQFIGRISYGLYLYHLPIFAWFGLASTGKSQSWLTAVEAIAITFGLALASFYWIEQPCIRWGRQQAILAHTPSQSKLQGWRLAGILAGFGLLLAGGLTLLTLRQSPPIAYMLNLVPKIPLEQRRYTLLPVGTAHNGYRWLGVDHYVDGLGFRRTQAISPPTTGVLRILTVGDSYTWGACVRENQTYSAVLEQELRDAGQQVEVINCGKAGGQAEDVVMTIRNQLLEYRPDVIIYAATMTDFLPANQGWGDHHIDEWYLPENEQRFQAAVTEMLKVCAENKIGFAAFVFFQNPSDTHAAEVALHIEQLLRTARSPIIPIGEYLRQYSDQDFRVCVPHDEHPNASCHRLFARLIAQAAKAGSIPGITFPQ